MKINHILFQVFTPLLVVIFLTQSLRYTTAVCFYKLNKDYVSQFLCVKKEIADNHCQGKCYLKKKLQEDDKNERDFLRVIKFVEIEVFNMFPSQKFNIFSLVVKLQFIPFIEKPVFAYSKDFFRPPCSDL